MECISISYKTAEAEKRQKFSFDEKGAEHFLKKLMKQDPVEQCVLLSTCNRTEIYVQGMQNCFGLLEELLAKAVDREVDEVRRIVRCYQGKKAVRHLFCVACGMDSMVIGEDEILGQVRNAYVRSADAGYTGYELNTVFQAALACAKRIKTETKISKTSVSIATLAANEVFRVPVSPKTVLLIGSSGQIGSIILKNILGHEGIRVIATTRTHKGLYQDSSGQVLNVDYKDRYDYVEEADVIISATSSPHYTITAGKAGEAMRTPKKRLYLDVSVPADIDEKIAMMDHCRLISIDDFKELAKKNNELKQQAVLDAQDILAEDVETLYKSLSFHAVSEKMNGWKEKYESYSFERLLFKLRDELDSDSFHAVLEALDR